MVKSLRLIKVLGATFLSVGAISICAGAINHSLSSKTEETNASSTVSSYYSTVSGSSANSSSGYNSLLESIYTKINKNLSRVAYGNLKTNGYPACYTRSDGYLYDIYCNNSYYTPGSAYTGSSNTAGGGYNREHTIPKSYWGGSESNMGCDLFIVLPSDTYINGVRSNYPYGITSSGTTYKKSGDNISHRLGTTTNTNYVASGTVFEPDDSRKGDLARIYFYSVAMYLKHTSSASDDLGPVSNWNGGGTVASGKTIFGSGTGYKNYIYSNYLNMLLKWHTDDPVDADEISRNGLIEDTQGNRNPFVDHPSWVDIIWGGTYGASKTNGEDTSSGTASVTNGVISGSTPSTKTLSSISINTNNVTTVFTVGDTFSYSGLVVTANYSDSTSATVSPTSVSSPDMSSAGQKTITVSYTESGTTKTATYTITVNASGGGGGGDSGDWVISDTAYKTAKFGSSYNSAGTSSYTGSFSSTYNSFTVNVVNANNNNNGWNYIKMGGKTGDITGTITTAAKIDKPIGRVKITIGAVTAGNITSIKLYTSTSSSFNGTSVGSFTVGTGEKTVDLSSPTANLFYKIEVVCTQNTSTNGLITINQVDYYDATQSSGGSDDPTLSGISVNTAPNKTTYTEGEYFDPTGLVINTVYSDTSYNSTVSYADHSSDFTFDPTTSTTLTTSDTSVQITYGGKSCNQTITVNSSGGSDSGTYQVTIDSSSSGSNNVHWTENNASLTYNLVTWSASYTGSASITSQKTYAQIGSKNNPATSVVFSTTAFAGMKITSASLTGYCMSNTGPALTITAGTTKMLDAEPLIKTTSTTYSSTTNNVIIPANGSLTFTINSSASAAIAVSKITVSYVDIESIAEAYAKTFVESGICGTNDNTPASSSIWSTMRTNYLAIDEDAQDILTNGQANASGSTYLAKCLAKYDRIIYLHGSDTTHFPNFMSRSGSSGARTLSNSLSNTTSTTLILVMVGITSSMIGVAFVGYWLKKKKEI